MARGRSSTPLPETRSPGRDWAGEADVEEMSGDGGEAVGGSFCSPRLHRLRRWRQAALTLNASCRFRYTQDLEKEEEKEMIRRKIQAHLQVIRLVRLFGPAPPEVTVQRDQGGPPPCDPTFGRRDRKAGRDGGLPMGHPEPHKIRSLSYTFNKYDQGYNNLQSEV
uniref:Calcium-transporting P-type ATPase N-terminal autoinhibitory domain-containing protein n=1 Tax=Oryza brachyantha TaxID=4533 RepID=J3MUF7_ORYBR